MITPLENNGMLARTQDISMFRHNEVQQPATEHVNTQNLIERKVDDIAHTVQNKSDSDRPDTRHDAREEGKNKYYDMRRKKNSKSDVPTEGVVKVKNHTGFDMTI